MSQSQQKNPIHSKTLAMILVILGVGFWMIFWGQKTSVAPTLPIVEQEVDEQALVETYIRKNIVTLAPEEAVLGGTWYVTSVVIDSSLKTGTMSYEDGHITGSASFSYRLEGTTIILENIAKK